MTTFSICFVGKPFNAQLVINNAVSNIICCLVFGHRFEYNDKKHERVLQALNETIVLQGGISAQVSLLCKQDAVIVIFLKKGDLYRVSVKEFFVIIIFIIIFII